MNTSKTSAIAALAAAVVCIAVTATAVTHKYVENFLSTLYRDAGNTTAVWDATMGSLYLGAFSPSQTGTFATSGSVNNVVVAAHNAYLADGAAGLTVVDVSNLAAPVLAGSYNTSGDALDVALRGQVAYVADGAGGLVVIDVSNPAAPTEVGSYAATGSIVSVAVGGGRAYVGDSTTGLVVLDITTPTPTLLGSAAALGTIVDIVVDGFYAYCADDAGAMLIYDVSDPILPAFLGGFYVPGTSGVAVTGDLAYVTAGTFVWAVDVSDPTFLSSLGSVDVGPSDATGIEVDGDIAYVANDNGGLVVLDVMTAAAMTIRHQYTTATAAADVFHSGRYAFVAEGAGGMEIVAVTQLAPGVATGMETLSNFADDVVLAGNHAYISTGVTGFTVVDIATPWLPSVVGNYATLGSTRRVAVAGDHAYLANGTDGLIVIDVSDPTMPAQVGSYATPNSAYSVAVSGRLAIVGDYQNGVFIFDISDPTTPVLLGSEGTPQNVSDLAISGDILYVADGVNGLRTIDISDPALPVAVGQYNTAGLATNLAVDGDLVYVADHFSGLKIVDVGDPSVPTLAGGLSTIGVALDVYVRRGLAFVATTTGNVNVVDVGDPSSPSSALVVPTDTTAYTVAVAGDYAFVGEQGQFEVIKVHENRLLYELNAVRSLAVDEEPYPIIKAKMSSVQQDSIAWLLSADGGANWDEFWPDGTWNTFSVQATGLLWDATIYRTGAPAPDPLCTDVEIDWLYEFAPIDSIVDVPDDTGGWVAMSFTRSAYDFVGEAIHPIIGYNIHQRIDDVALAQRVCSEGIKVKSNGIAVTELDALGEAPDVPFVGDAPGMETYRLGERYFVVTTGADGPVAAPPGTWEIVGAVFAAQTDEYSLDVPTLGDAGTTIPWAVMYVTAHTTTPSVFYSSPPDSGYSVDNSATATGDAPAAAAAALHQNAPNPFNPTTTIRYDVVASGAVVTLEVFDVRGRLVRTLVNGAQTAGPKSALWNGRDNNGNPVASGVYIYRLRANGMVQSRKMTLVK